MYIHILYVSFSSGKLLNWSISKWSWENEANFECCKWKLMGKMHRESHNVCQKLFLYEQSVAPPPPPHLNSVTGHVLRMFCVCVGVRVSVWALALPLIANGSSFIPPPTLLGPRNFALGLYFVHWQIPWVFHFPLFPQIKFSKLFAAKLSTHHSQSANWQRTERLTVRHKK